MNLRGNITKQNILPKSPYLIKITKLGHSESNISYFFLFKKNQFRASLVAQWLRILLPMQGARVRARVREDATCRGAPKPVHHNY